MEIIDIADSNLEPFHMNMSSSDRPSVNFGSGVELLMNDKKRSSSNNVNIDMEDLNSLEKELNDLSDKNASSSQTKKLSGFSNFFGFNGSTPVANEPESQFGNDSNLGKASKESASSSKTWDGFSKVNDIPQQQSVPNLSDREKRRKKRMMIKRLEEWNEKGFIKNSSHFNIDSDYNEIEDEYETALDDKHRKDGIKLQQWWFMTFVNSLEFANTSFDPFGLNLEGWGEQVSEDIESYDEIFGELHEKYKGGKLAPELSILLRLGFSAAVVNFSNKALSSAQPGFNDVIKNSPALMKTFTNATVDLMSQKSPGFGFINNLVNNPDQLNTTFGPPPQAVETKGSVAPPRPGMQYTSRPDLQAGRGQNPMFREQGVDIGQPLSYTNQNPPIPQTPSLPKRPEMRGPQSSNVDQILSSLKPIVTPQQNVRVETVLEDDSIISIASLKELQNTNLPKRINSRKPRSERNVVSLDI